MPRNSSRDLDRLVHRQILKLGEMLSLYVGVPSAKIKVVRREYIFLNIFFGKVTREAQKKRMEI